MEQQRPTGQGVVAQEPSWRSDRAGRKRGLERVDVRRVSVRRRVVMYIVSCLRLKKLEQ